MVNKDGYYKVKRMILLYFLQEIDQIFIGGET